MNTPGAGLRHRRSRDIESRVVPDAEAEREKVLGGVVEALERVMRRLVGSGLGRVPLSGVQEEDGDAAG